MTEIEQNIIESNQNFIKYVWPNIRDLIGGGIIKSCEMNRIYDYNNDLDTAGGVDLWQILPENKGIRSIASRVQYYRDDWKNKYPFNTFTIRYSLNNSDQITECQKRELALAHKGILYPSLTIQAYLDKLKNLWTVGIINTDDLFAAKRRLHYQPLKVDGGNEMIYFKWDRIEKLGYKIIKWDKNISSQLNLFP